MKKALISDVSRVILFPKEKSYTGSLNELNKRLMGSSDYNALDHFETNKELLKFYKGLGIDLYIFTSDIIQDRPEFSEDLKIFKSIYSANKLGLSKRERSAYIKLVELIGKNPGEIVYVDDNEENVLAAQQAGLDAIKYENNDQVFSELKKRFY